MCGVSLHNFLPQLATELGKIVQDDLFSRACAFLVSFFSMLSAVSLLFHWDSSCKPTCQALRVDLGDSGFMVLFLG